MKVSHEPEGQPKHHGGPLLHQLSVLQPKRWQRPQRSMSGVKVQRNDVDGRVERAGSSETEGTVRGTCSWLDPPPSPCWPSSNLPLRRTVSTPPSNKKPTVCYIQIIPLHASLVPAVSANAAPPAHPGQEAPKVAQ